MKKIAALCTAALLLAAAPMAVSADTEEIPQETEAQELLYRYGLDAEGNAELYDFISSDTYEGPVVIPAEIDGHPVDYIGNGCFVNAAGITEVTIPACIADMGSCVFMGCTALERFYVESGNPYYSVTADGILLEDHGGMLTAYPAAREDSTYEIPADVDEISPGAFSFAKNLKEISIPEGVLYIDNWAFAYSGIEKLSVAGSVSMIDDYAFAYCDALAEVNLSPGIESIYNASFCFDSALEQITLPDTLTYIGQYAFCGTGLTCVTIPDSLETISYCAFGYDGSYNAITDFTIYGEPYTMAQTYATDRDSENDYQNNFKFVAVADASVPYELGEGKLYEEAAEEVVTETNENGEVIVIETDAEGNAVDPTEELGAGLKDNHKLQMILGIGGGVAVLLALILIVNFVRKPGKSGEKPEETPEHAEPEESDQKKDEEA